MKLTDMITQHPGGWSDIIANVGAYARGMTVDVSSMNWVQEYMRTEKGKVSSISITKVPMPDGHTSSNVNLYDFLCTDFDGSSGVIASNIYRVMMRYGFPVPGDKEWLKPSSSWGIWGRL